jgi:hypothetical protein
MPPGTPAFDQSAARLGVMIPFQEPGEFCENNRGAVGSENIAKPAKVQQTVRRWRFDTRISSTRLTPILEFPGSLIPAHAASAEGLAVIACAILLNPRSTLPRITIDSA